VKKQAFGFFLIQAHHGAGQGKELISDRESKRAIYTMGRLVKAVGLSSSLIAIPLLVISLEI
jgi:hypothetical protein